jgi:hypothetical protein
LFIVNLLSRALIPPLVAAALMLAGFAGAALYSGASFFAYDTWIKWDSGHYLTIANTGYTFMSCAELPGYDPSQWCGNTGWFPGYPLLLRVLHAVTGQPTIRLAVLVSQAFTVIDLGLVWNLFLRRRNFVVLALCAFGPGTYYFLVGFPVSLALCFIIVALWARREEHDDVALLAGVFAGMTYPSGIWLTVVATMDLLIRQTRGDRPKAAAWIAAAGPVIGFAAVVLIHYLVVGRWNAFFLTQQKYALGVFNPLAVLWQRILVIWAWESTWWRIGLQSLLAATLVVCATIGMAAAARRRAGERGDLLLGLYGVVFWLIPLVLGRLSPSRAEAFLMPMNAAAARLPAVIQVALLAAAVAIWMIMAAEFIKGALV